MVNGQELEEAFGQFITFGVVFDEPTRRYLVHYLYARLRPGYLAQLPALSAESRYLEYLTTALDRMLAHEGLLEAARHGDVMTRQLMEDVLRWVRKVDKKITETNPYHLEKQKFEAWTHKPTFLWRDTWYQAVNEVRSHYTPAEIDADFYTGKFRQLLPTAPANLAEQELADRQPRKSDIDIVIDDFLAQWDALLTAKILAHQIEEIEKEGEPFVQTLHAKIEEYHKIFQLIAPVAHEAGRFWDMSRGLWKDAGFDILDRYGALLEKEEGIRELVDLLGRMREAEIELEEEILTEVIVRKEWVPDERRKDEIAGLNGSNDLNRVLPSELAFMADEDTEAAFYQRFAEQQLLSFRYQGKKLVTSDRVQYSSTQRQKRREKGPFVLCIDTSGSMHGLPAQIAKVLTFAIIKMAAREQRRCYLINFSIGIKTIHLHDIAGNMDKIVEFLLMSFDGGTDVTPALSEALNVLQTHDYKEADVLMVSDFVMFEIRAELLDRIRREQHRGTRFHSLTIATRYNPEVLDQFDNCWIYDPDSKTVLKQLLADLHRLSEAYERIESNRALG